MHAGGVSTHLLEHTRGALTGSSSAGIVARILVEDSLCLARANFVSPFCINDEYVLDAMAWSDNLVTISSTLENAIANMQAWRDVLHAVFNVNLKADSLVAVPARTQRQGSRVVSVSGERWTVGDRVKCLGSWVTGTGEDGSDRDLLMSAWTRVFWANVKFLTNRRASVASRMRFWKSLTQSVSDYVWAGIRPSLRSIQGLEASFNRHVSRIVGARPEDGQSKDSCCRARNGLIQKAKSEARIDLRFRFAYRVVSWVEHLSRHSSRPAFLLLNSQDDAWLRIRRLCVGKFGTSRSISSGETATRSGPGFPIRWASQWLDEVGCAGGGWTNAERDSQVTKNRAHILRALFLTSGGHLALQDGSA